MIKILFVIGQLDIGGAEQQLLYLAENLDKKKYQVKICCLSKYLGILSQKQLDDLDIVVIPQIMKPDLTRPYKLLRIVKQYQPDLIHSYLFVANTWARIIGTMCRVPVIISERNSMSKEPILFRFTNIFLRFLGSFLIVNSHDGAKRIISRKQFNPDKIKVIHNGIPIDKYSYQHKSENLEILKNQFGIQDYEKTIGIIGRLTYQKNHELLIRSFLKIRQLIPKIKILCIGDGPRREALKIFAKELGLEDSIIFTGRRDDIPACLAIIDALALTSRWEGCPNVILEAMAAKVPVIATNVGGLSEIITDGETGFLIEPDNEDQLSKRILSIINYPQQAEVIIQNAFLEVKNNFSLEKMVSETEKIYSKLLNK